MRRAFCVGCPRSGTTLVQAMLSRHPEVYSPPETHVFRKMYRPRGGLSKIATAALPRAGYRALKSLLKRVDRPDLEPMIPKAWTRRRYAEAFCAILDRIASEQGAGLWVEKTPAHLHYVEEIAEVVPAAKFVHIVRDPRDVVASFYDACVKEPETWVHQVLPGRDRADTDRLIDAIVDRWRSDRAISRRYHGREGHTEVTYETLVAEPEAELERLAGFLGLAYDPAMLRYWETADRLVGLGTAGRWMEQTFKPIRDTHLKKYRELFTDAQRRRVEQRLAQPAVGDSPSGFSGSSASG